ncbi:MAG: transcriptional regulator [Rhizobiaceae bacterium]|nr:transcriptional regulator [Rhizobiaceae bacterium]
MKSKYTILSVAIFALGFLWFTPQVYAQNSTELIMVEQEYCEWCEKWHEEIGGIYDKTAEGKRAPVRHVDIYEDKPADLADVELGRFTPTFILMNEGKEVARLRGYPGDEYFWYLLGQMLDKLPKQAKKPTG